MKLAGLIEEAAGKKENKKVRRKQKMDLKRHNQEDIDQTFFDMEEFASAHVIDGKEC